MHNWKNKFRKIILERGEDYYYGGLVCDLQKEDYGYSAVVKGSEDYDVDIYIEDDEVSDMDCDCPYAGDGHNCKHMAAVLFAIEDNGESLSKESTQSIDEILEVMSEDDLRKELSEIVKNEPNIRNRIFNSYRSSYFDSGDVYRFRKNLEGLTYEYEDHHGFIDWRNGFDYVRGFCECLSDFVGPMIARKQYPVAFKALKEVADVLMRVEMDGSGGEHSLIAEDIGAYLQDVIESCDEKTRDEIHDWIESKKDDEYYFIVEDELEEIYEQSFNDEKYLLKMLDDVKEKIDDPERESYHFRHDLDLYKSVLKRLGKDDSEYEIWLNDYDDLEDVIRIRLEQAKEKEDIEKTIEILERIIADDRFRWKSDYYHELFDLHIRKNDRDKQKETLIRILEYENYSELNDLYKLKEYCNKEEWIKYRDKCIEKNKDIRPELYYRESMLKQLAESLNDYPVDITDKYAEAISEKYSNMILDRYLLHLKKFEGRYTSRPVYEEMERYFRKAFKYDNDGSLRKLLESWRVKYPTKKVMQQMIDKLL